jgi:hypothetical protein
MSEDRFVGSGEWFIEKAKECIGRGDLDGVIAVYQTGAKKGYMSSAFYLACILQDLGRTAEAAHWWRQIRPGAPETLDDAEKARAWACITGLRAKGLL